MGQDIHTALMQQAHAQYASLYASSTFAPPARMAGLVDLWTFLTRAQIEAVAAANNYLAHRSVFTSAQRAEYAGLRNLWQEAQRSVYDFTRLQTRSIEGTAGPALSDRLMSSVPYPGWLPDLSSTAHAIPASVSSADRDPAGKRMFIGSYGLAPVGAFVDAHAGTDVYFGQNGTVGLSTALKVYGIGLLAASLKRRVFAVPNTPTTITAATSPTYSLPGMPTYGSVPNVANTPVTGDAAAVATHVTASGQHVSSTSSNPAVNPTGSDVLAYQAAADAGTPSYWPYYVAAGVVGVFGLWYFVFRKPKRGVRGLGEATRLRTLRDPVPSRYGLEV